MSVAAGPVAVPDSTGPTFALLRELRRGRARKQAASIAFWIYLALFIVAVWGGSLIVAAYRALRHPPPPTGLSLRVLHALPAGLAALALLVLLMLVRDALWRGPVTVPGATVDWLLGTPVDRRRLLRPRFRLSASGAIAAGAAVGIVPAAALVALGLGGRDGGDVLRLTGPAYCPPHCCSRPAPGWPGWSNGIRRAGPGCAGPPRWRWPPRPCSAASRPGRRSARCLRW